MKILIEKLTIEKKIKIRKLLSNNIYIYKPGIIFNYGEKFTWTNEITIGFINHKYYNIL